MLGEIPPSSLPQQGGAEWTQQAQDLIPLATALLDSKDPRMNLQVWKARVRNYQEMKKRFPMLALFYDNEIRKLQAKIQGVSELVYEKRESENNWRTWQTLGQGSVVIGVGAVSLFILFAAARIAR